MEKFVLFVAAMARTLYDAWVVLMLWGWFIVPLGAPRITFWHAYGLDIILGLMAVPNMAALYARTADSDDSYKTSLRSFSVMLVAYTTALIFGFAAYKFNGGV